MIVGCLILFVVCLLAYCVYCGWIAIFAVFFGLLCLGLMLVCFVGFAICLWCGVDFLWTCALVFGVLACLLVCYCCHGAL